MASSDGSGSGLMDVIHGLFGSALEIPQSFRQPGTAGIYQGYFGSLATNGLDFASLNAGPSVTAPVSIFSKGLNEFVGESTQTGLFWTKGEHIVTGIELRTKVTNNSLKGAVNTIVGKRNTIVGKRTTVSGVKCTVSGATVNISGGNIRIGGQNWYAKVSSWDSKKGFDIPHPTKEDHRLRYICVEGPSAEVYLRGKLKDNNIIELPEYWRNLVDLETIGVTLTPIGHYQELFVEKIEWGTKIIIKNNSGAAINCNYVVFAERKDGEKNIPEYKGLTPADYPGDNNEYVINGKKYE